jgi:hypothetical protein
MPWIARRTLQILNDELARKTDVIIERTVAASTAKAEAKALESHLDYQRSLTDRLLTELMRMKVAGAVPAAPVVKPRQERPDPEQLALDRSDREFIESYVEDAISANKDLDKDALEEEGRRIRREVREGIPGT